MEISPQKGVPIFNALVGWTPIRDGKFGHKKLVTSVYRIIIIIIIIIIILAQGTSFPKGLGN